MLEILNATEAQQLDQVRGLMRAFVTWVRHHYSANAQMIDDYFGGHAFETELLSLPGKYAMPEGQLLLALHEGQPAGCVGLRRLDADSCEMKRLFVSTQFQGKGIGRALVKTLIQNARALGYSAMRLDTGSQQIAAQKLYHSVGFQRIQPYYEVSQVLKEGMVFMELAL